jgi:HlyD family secretion protein
MTLIRRLIPWLVAAALAVLGYFGYAYYQRVQAEAAQAAQLASLRTETIRRGDLAARVSATGSLLPEQQSSLSFALPGTVVEVLVESGQAVRAGDLLARLDDTTLRLAVLQAEDALAVAGLNRDKLLAGPDSTDIAVAEANLRAANARLAEAAAGAGDQEVAIARLRYDNLLADYQALSNQYNSLVLFAEENPLFAPPQDTLDSLRGNVENAFFTSEVARLQLEQLQRGGGPGPVSVAYAQVAQARAVLTQTLTAATPLQIEQADLAVEQAAAALERAEWRLGLVELRAPFAGVVGVVNVKRGEPAGPGVPAIVLLNVASFHLDVNVDEVDVGRLAPGQPVSVTVEALPGVSLNGRVDRIAPTAVVVGGLVNYLVRLDLDPAEAPVRAGMSATASILVAEVRDVVLAPNWAIRRDRRTGQAYASLQRGEALVEVPITAGLRGDAYTEVLAGVQPGDVAAVSTARDGISLFGGGQ